MGAGRRSIWLQTMEKRTTVPKEGKDSLDAETKPKKVEKQVILDMIDDLVLRFTYYDRKESVALPRGSLERALEEGEITVDEMVNQFRKSLEETFNGRR